MGVTASASPVLGGGAHFNVVVDGVTIGEATAGAASRTFNFAAQFTSGQPHDIQVVFDNDAATATQDRNLFLQSISVDGQIAAATTPLEVFHAPFNPGPGDEVGNGNVLEWRG